MKKVTDSGNKAMPSAQKQQTETMQSEPSSGSRMFDLSTQQRVDRVPPEFWPGIPIAKGHDELFVGRVQQLDELMRRHGRIPEDISPELSADEQSFITVVSNAPGVGKSALVDELAIQHDQSGGYCLELFPDDLTDRDALREALLDSEPAQQAQLLRDAKMVKRFTKALDAAAGAAGGMDAGISSTVFEWVVKAATKLGEVRPNKPGSEAHARMVQQLATHAESLKAMALLRLMGQGANGRLLIIIDEAQELGERNSPKTAELLQQLGDPSSRSRLGLQSGGLVLAGLPDAIQKLQQMHKSRAYHMHLEPLSGEEVEQLIRRACHNADPADKLDKADVNKIVQALAADFSEWTHHAHAAAHAARGIIRRRLRQSLGHRTWDIDEMIDWMRTAAALGTCRLYDAVADRAVTIIGAEGTLEIVQAMQQTGEVPTDLINKLIKRNENNRNMNERAGMSDQEAQGVLLHCGLIGRQRNAGGGLTGKMEVPIPSLTQYLNVTGGQGMRQNIVEPARRTPEIDVSDERRGKGKPRTDD